MWLFVVAVVRYMFTTRRQRLWHCQPAAHGVVRLDSSLPQTLLSLSMTVASSAYSNLHATRRQLDTLTVDVHARHSLGVGPRSTLPLSTQLRRMLIWLLAVLA